MSVNETALGAELAARQGVTTTKRLARLGIGRRQVDTLVHHGRLRRAGKGVLISTSWPDDLDHRMAVACAITGGVVMFPTAGLAWGLRKTLRVPEIHLWVAESRRVKAPPGVQIHLTRHLPETDIVRRDDGVVLTSPPRTAFDAARWLQPDDLESLIEHGIDLGYFVVPTLWRIHRQARAQGRPGTARFEAVLAARDAARRPVRSDHELRLERAMRRRGFPPLVREHRLVLPDGHVIHPDLGIPEHRFYVEVDHLMWHGRRRQSAYDRERDLKVRAYGYFVERVTDVALDHDLDATIEHLWTIWRRIVG